MLWFIILVTAVASLFWVRWRIVNKKLLEFSDKVPGPATMPILGNALEFMVPSEELINVFGRMIKEYGDVFRIWLGPDMNVFVSDPDDIKTLLTNSKTSVKGPQYKYIGDFCGAGILSGSGSSWRTSRRTVLPNYGKNALESYGEVINIEARETAKRLRTKAGGKTFDIYGDIVTGTTYIVCQSIMGLTKEQTINLPNLDNLCVHEAHDMYHLVFKRMTTWYLQIEPFYWMTGSYRQQSKFQNAIQGLTHAIVQHRLKIVEAMDEEKKHKLLNVEGDNRYNTELSVVDRLVLTNQTPSYEELLKQLFTVLTSSQEATGKITSFLLQMMAYHPECQDKVYAEIKEVIGDSDRDVTTADLKRMTYLEMVFKEVIRLFPTGVMLQRTIAEDITMSKGTLPAGSSLIVPIFHLHRDKRHWDNPNTFEPERFAPEKSQMRHPYCYLPFSLGPMDCIGRFYANKVVKTIAINVLREFRLTSPEKYEDMKLIMAVSIASVNGYPIQLHSR